MCVILVSFFPRLFLSFGAGVYIVLKALQHAQQIIIGIVITISIIVIAPFEF